MKKKLTLVANQLHSSKGRLLLFILSIAMFVVSAGAPAATIGIGK